jgi:sensor histidine kinase YesM
MHLVQISVKKLDYNKSSSFPILHAFYLHINVMFYHSLSLSLSSLSFLSFQTEQILFRIVTEVIYFFIRIQGLRK